MDCGVACLAMICGVSYEAALIAVAKIVPDICTDGIYANRQLKAAAKDLGFKLRVTRRIDWEQDTGILNVVLETREHDHLVVLREGLVIETDGTLWEPDVFLRHNNGRPGTLLVAESL